MYPTELSVKSILEQTRLQPGETYDGAISHGVKIDVLNNICRPIDPQDAKQRRQLYERLYHESLLIDTGYGISFTSMLLLLAHYKLIDDNNALQ